MLEAKKKPSDIPNPLPVNVVNFTHECDINSILTFKDSSAKKNDLILSSDTIKLDVVDSPFSAGKSILFHGGDSNGENGQSLYSSSLDFNINQPFSIEGNIRLTGLTGTQFAISKGYDANDSTYFLYEQNSKLHFGIRDSLGNQKITNSADITPNTNISFKGEWTGSAVNLYIANIIVDTIAATSIESFNHYPFRLGGDSRYPLDSVHPANKPLFGYLDDIKVTVNGTVVGDYHFEELGCISNNATDTTAKEISDKLTNGSQVTKLKNAAGTTINPSTEEKQDTLILANHTDLAAILGKIITAPSTEAKQDLMVTALGNILAKIIATPATEAKQDALITANHTDLAAILAELRDDTFTTSFLWEDASVTPHVFYREDRVKSQDDGTVTVVITRLSDNTVIGSLPANAKPVAADGSKKVEFYRYIAIGSGTGYSTGDWVTNTIIHDIGTNTIVANSWYNLTTAATIASAPSFANLKDPEYDNNLEATQLLIKAKTDNLDIALSALRDAIRGSGTKDFTTVQTRIDLLLSESDFDTKIGSLTETAPASDTASSGLNGRLQRIAQRLTSLIALIPTSLGQKTMANSFAVVLSSDQAAIPVNATLAAETTKVIGTVNQGTSPWVVSSTLANPAVNANAASRFTNFGANATLNVKATAGNVFSLTCINKNALAARYIQLHNTATVPASGAAPIVTFLVPANGQIVIGTDFFTDFGSYFSTGIAFAYSTTPDTYTAATAGDQTTIIRYI